MESNLFIGNVISIDGQDDLDKFLSFEYSQQDETGKMTLNLKLDSYGETEIGRLMELIKKIHAKNLVVDLKINASQMDFTVGDFERFIDLEYELEKLSSRLVFVDINTEFTLDETLGAFAKAQSVIIDVNSRNLSPFEKYLMIYNFITGLKYNESESGSGYARSIIGVLNSDEIVCVGYSDLLKYMCKAVGIECYTQTVEIVDKNGEVDFHQNNIVSIKDEKYNIDGTFYADACWDSVDDGEEPFLKYNFCLVPFQDVNKILGDTIVPSHIDFLYCDQSEEVKKFEYDKLAWGMEDLEEVFRDFDFDIDTSKTLAMFNDGTNATNKIKDAAAFVLKMFEEIGVPKNIYSKLKECPQIYMPSKFISYCMLDGFSVDLIKEHVVDFKNYYEMVMSQRKHGDDSDFDCFTVQIKEQYGLNDVYQFYNKLIETDFDDILLNNIFENMCVYENIERLKEFLLTAKRKSKPITLDVFKKAIKNIWLSYNKSDKQASEFANRAIQNTVNMSKVCFSDGAINCFSEEYLKQKQMH